MNFHRKCPAYVNKVSLRDRQRVSVMSEAGIALPFASCTRLCVSPSHNNQKQAQTRKAHGIGGDVFDVLEGTCRCGIMLRCTYEYVIS